MEKYTIIRERYNPQLGITRETKYTGTLAELIKEFSYTLECGRAYQHESGANEIDLQPEDICALVDNLNDAEENRAANGCSNISYYIA